MKWPEFILVQKNANVVCSETENDVYIGNCRMDISVEKLKYFAERRVMYLFDCCFGEDERYVYCCDAEELNEALENYCIVNVNGTPRYCFYFQFERGIIYNLKRERVLDVEPVADEKEYAMYKKIMI